MKESHTEIICPSCGKNNPGDRLDCQFCGKPLRSTGPSTTETVPEKNGAIPENPVPEGNTPAKEIPEWIAKDIAEVPPPDAAPQSLLPDWLNGEISTNPNPSQDLPEWLSDLDIPPTQSDATPMKEEPPSETDLAWLSELESLHPLDAQPENQEAASPPETSQPAPQSTEPQPSPEEKQPVDQPSVQPAEPALSDTDRHLIKIGPLAGLPGLIPADSLVVQMTKPTAYLAKPPVPEPQKKHIALLEQMIEEEAESTPLRHRVAFPSQPVFRILMAIILITAVFWGLIVGSPAEMRSDSSEVQEAYDIVQKLTNDAIILFAVDYEPGFSGEMEAASQAVLKHALSRGASVMMVSTSPTGPLQGERLLNLINQDRLENQQASSTYVNLGFIPGGSAGLASFVRSPQKTLPLTYNQQPAWKQKPFDEITLLSKFSLIIVATEKPETARDWIEQVQPKLETTPLLMVLSEQAAPLIRPYFKADPQKVQAFVVGLMGGANYESSSSNMSLATGYMKPLSLGILTAIGLMILGAIFNIAAWFWSRNIKPRNHHPDESTVPQ